MTSHGKNSGGSIKANRHTVVSLFAGCGGFDLGFLGGFRYKQRLFRKLPFHIKEAYDNDERCLQTYRMNLGIDIQNADLSNCDFTNTPKADVLIGGFPCQDFSSCGPQRGLSSSRGRLYQALVRYMILRRPKVVVAENVPHLARMKGGMVLDNILREFREAKYKVHVWTLYAPQYGVPQHRTRLFIVALRTGLPGLVRKPEALYGAESYRTVDWAISDIETITDESLPNQSQYFRASKAKRGNGQGDEKNRAGEPAYTIRANAKSRVQFHYRLPRRLTVRECARLQTFPDDFVFPHSATANVMQIGNAVPPVLGYHVAKTISNYLKTLNSGVDRTKRRRKR